MRMKPKNRKQLILKAAVKIARKKGYNILTREEVAYRAKVSKALVSHYFGTIEKLRTEIMAYAIENLEYSIIVQGLAIKDKRVKRISCNLKYEALHYLSHY